MKTEDFTPQENYVLNSKNSVLSFAFNYDKESGTRLSSTAASCHYEVRHIEPTLVRDFSGSFKGYDEGKELWDYLISPAGPYRKLWEFAGPPEPFGRDGKIIGYSLPNKIWQFPTYPLLYSFFICTRIPGEKSTHLKSFSYLLRKGYEPNLAFLFSKHLSYAPQTGLMTGSSFWSGSHDALIEGVRIYNESSRTYSPGYIDVKKWCEGDFAEVDKKSASASSLFLMKTPPKKAPFMRDLAWGAYTKKAKAGFTTVSVVPEDQELKMFEDWKKLVEMRYP